MVLSASVFVPTDLTSFRRPLSGSESVIGDVTSYEVESVDMTGCTMFWRPLTNSTTAPKNTCSHWHAVHITGITSIIVSFSNTSVDTGTHCVPNIFSISLHILVASNKSYFGAGRT